MPWSNQGDGWKGSGGDDGGRSPWGGGGSGQGGGPQPPNLEDILRKGQDRFKGAIPPGRWGGRGIMIGLLVLVVLWLASGFYRVGTEEQGVVLRFGKYVETTAPGLHYHLPAPIESVETPKVARISRVEVGFRGSGDARSGRSSDQPQESLMLTGDENIVDIDFAILWKIGVAKDFLFNIRNPEQTVKAVAESVMREVVGNTKIDDVLTEGRQQVELRTRSELQEIMNNYVSGIEIVEVKLQSVDPPGQVIESFRDVQAARADQERKRNEAEAYSNDIIPRARGEAAQARLDAEGYKEQTVADAEGQVSRYLAILGEYEKAKDVTRQRMYLETMEQVMGGMEKIVIDNAKGGTGVVPYLPLPEIEKRRGENEGETK
jgi:membrane protease subunit HflK